MVSLRMDMHVVSFSSIISSLSAYCGVVRSVGFRVRSAKADRGGGQESRVGEGSGARHVPHFETRQAMHPPSHLHRAQRTWSVCVWSDGSLRDPTSSRRDAQYPTGSATADAPSAPDMVGPQGATRECGIKLVRARAPNNLQLLEVHEGTAAVVLGEVECVGATAW
jgi:hypothetical protein